MRYEGTIYRPPSEWQSYLLQVTTGCSHNTCTFCGMFKGKAYTVRSIEDIFEDIDAARGHYGNIEHVFLCDGDAIAIPTESLLAILHHITKTFPDVQTIATYAGPRSTLSKSAEELSELRKAGLNRAYLGVESGDDQVLKETCKGVTASEMLEAGRRLVQAGIELYAIVLIGLAGRERSRENSSATAELINKMKPAHLAAMTYMPVEGTKMYRDIQAGKFHVLNERESLAETKALLEGLTVDPLHFTSSHASNYMPLEGVLVRDKERLIALIDAALSGEVPIHETTNRRL